MVFLVNHIFQGLACLAISIFESLLCQVRLVIGFEFRTIHFTYEFKASSFVTNSAPWR
ncbi:hypothetical protein F0Z19_2722 [Vibrio cyclitrophicus]|nr:hypothetical protein F0Z19_2722 [Vibrio cyclitrophicus]